MATDRRVLFSITQAARAKVLVNLIKADASLSGNAAVIEYLQRLERRRCPVNCLVCHGVSKTIWSHIYDKDEHVGFHCPQHSNEFHAVEMSRRHCCDVRTSSLESEFLPPEAGRDSDGISEGTMTTTSQIDNPQSE